MLGNHEAVARLGRQKGTLHARSEPTQTRRSRAEGRSAAGSRAKSTFAKRNADSADTPSSARTGGGATATAGTSSKTAGRGVGRGWLGQDV